jgi:DNA-binding GntR family transcriptional regulator
LAERAFTELHAAILSGTLVPGQRLPIEDLAAQMAMSPMPIREALRQLDAAGLVEHVPHRGARVTELSLGDLREIYDARLALEPLAVRRAAEQFDEQDVERAREALMRLDRAQRSKADDEIWEAHSAFHFALYRGARSHWLEGLIQPLWESSERYRRATPAKRKFSDRRDEHARMLQACIDGDSERAARETYTHLARTANRVALEMGGQELFPVEESRASA